MDMQGLPCRSKHCIPIVMACGRHDEKYQQSEQAEQLKRETAKALVISSGSHHRNNWIDVAKTVIPENCQRPMNQGDDEEGYAEVSPVIEQGQKPAVDPGQRTDAENQGKHDKSASREGTDQNYGRRDCVLALKPAMADQNKQ